MTTALVGATVIDGTGNAPLENALILISDGRILSVRPSEGAEIPVDAETIRVDGQYVIPGLLDANVHLVLHCEPDVLLRFEPGEYDTLVLEAAQVALKAGFTTVFDTWGPLASIQRVRDRIDAGDVPGSRIFCAGNIIGNGGPWSPDFYPQSGIDSAVVEEVNRHWAHGVGDDLPWRAVEEVRSAVREYLAETRVDFVKFAGSSHKDLKFLTFAPDVQRAIVEEAHAAGLTAQACTCTPEAVMVVLDAGVDLLQHGDLTGRYPMPQETVDRIAATQIPCVAFLTTDRFMAAIDASDNGRLGDLFSAKDVNDRALITAGAKLLLGTDGGVYGPTWPESPVWGPVLALPDWYGLLGQSHLHWFRAAAERSMHPMDILKSATSNVAEAYGKDGDLGTLEPGKRADLLVLDGNPLDDVANYGRISRILKDGVLVDRERLPEQPVLTGV